MKRVNINNIDIIGGNIMIANSLIDMYGTMGDIEPAKHIKPNIESCLIMLISLISSSRIQNDLKWGKRIFEKINDIVNKFKNENHDIIKYKQKGSVLLSNIYGRNRNKRMWICNKICVILFTFVSILLFTLSIRLFHQLINIKKG